MRKVGARKESRFGASGTRMNGVPFESSKPMELTRVTEYWQAATGSLNRLCTGRSRGTRSRGRVNRLRRFGPHTMIIRQRLADLESIRQSAQARR